MVNADLLDLIRCPKTGERLHFSETLREYPFLRESVDPARHDHADGFLVNESETWAYPMLGKVPSLISSAALHRDAGNLHAGDKLAAIRAAQMEQMRKFSALHDTYYSEPTIALHAYLRKHYYPRFAGASVMDIGNGGLSPVEQYGAELAGSLSLFVAIDHSHEMLTRKGHFDHQVIADAKEFRFADNCVDYIVLNGIIHHLGLEKGEDPPGKIQEFMTRMINMSRKGVIVMDLLVPAMGEWMERATLNILGEMPTFVFSRQSFLSFLKSGQDEVTELRIESITSLISPLCLVSPLIELSWLRIPAIMVPYKFIFLYLKKS